MNEMNIPAIRFAGFAEDWEKRKLSAIASIKARIGWQGLTQKEFLDGGDYYLITGTDFAEGTIDFPNCHYIGEDRYKQDTNIQVKARDVLITKDGTIGKVAYIKELDKPATLNAGVFVIRGRDESTSNLYMYHYLAAPFLLDYADEQATGGTIKHLNQNVLVNFPVPMPSVAEQEKVGQFFSAVNDLITLHQREHDKTVNIKKALLEKMFPKAGEDKPEIRFAGFTASWERRKFDTFFDIIPNNTLSRARLSYGEGEIKSVHYGDILIKYGAVTDCITDEIPFITEAKASEYRSAYLQNGDVLIADTAEDETVGKTTELTGITNIPVVSGLHTIACRPKIKMHKSYLGYFLNSPSFHKQLLPLMQGIKVLSISRTNLGKTLVNYPAATQEQAKIGQTFANLDRLIALHKRELTKLQNIKKALLEKMFV